MKALELVKVGGRVVFSTCSLNPIENEAVLAAAMLWGRGGGGGEAEDGGMHWVRMVDVEGEVEGLKWMPGLREWKVSYTQASLRLKICLSCHLYMCMKIYICVYTFMEVCMYACVHDFIRTLTHARTHTHTHKHTHTHTGTGQTGRLGDLRKFRRRTPLPHRSPARRSAASA